MQWHIGASAGQSTECLGYACPPIYVVQATLGEFGPHAGNMKSNTQNEVWISKHIIIYLILPVYILYIMCNKNIDIKTEKTD